MTNLLFKLLFAAFLLSFPVTGKAQEIGAGVWCDTREQVAQFIGEVKNDPAATVAKVNAEAGSEHACVLSYVAFYRGDEVATIRNGSGAWTITEILVIAVGVNGSLIRVEPKVFYTAFRKDERGA